jgi:hypothetical protein
MRTKSGGQSKRRVEEKRSTAILKRPPNPTRSESSEPSEAVLGDRRAHQALLDAQARFSELYSKTLTTLAGGALAGGEPRWPWLLCVGWLFLICALLAALFASFQATQAIEQSVGSFYAEPPSDRRYPEINWLNKAGAILLALGFAVLALFSILNAWR